MMADIIRRSVWSGPGLEDVGAVFTDGSYQRTPRPGKGKSPRFLGILFERRWVRRRVDAHDVRKRFREPSVMVVPETASHAVTLARCGESRLEPAAMGIGGAAWVAGSLPGHDDIGGCRD
jgi:hypothetical protein